MTKWRQQHIGSLQHSYIYIGLSIGRRQQQGLVTSTLDGLPSAWWERQQEKSMDFDSDSQERLFQRGVSCRLALSTYWKYARSKEWCLTHTTNTHSLETTACLQWVGTVIIRWQRQSIIWEENDFVSNAVSTGAFLEEVFFWKKKQGPWGKLVRSIKEPSPSVLPTRRPLLTEARKNK